MNSRVLVCQIRSAGYTQQDISERIGGLTQRSVAYWQEGKRVTPDQLGKLVDLRDRLQVAGRVKLTEHEASQLIALTDKGGMSYVVVR